ncbi:hypothetical protein PHYBLDRAFT_60557 [Phycomyces blakesleeanus NRRL 1555(-)]|uniref:Uncharacterized protein n=1 Tax=Phycomyces blakesleeanus (strain ATCC 8743b / DSM 1359 / FGSC 10004 / NBRC 33097 / NRRL 1555) TaxID=763407 RepID=A0A167P7T9_PHYB8|nr:hypothetical protein PHYBLDRAFT_60557 [Phycomyces blakesleeanus NRRL 1555(-)]OAD77424.1 hypothetical protein PHYBLDRAFT_60557 [Phycomyces blakesleeanus NRRL 1555(-)]|eukprot:XP_018295464.1 hypothetical protein PHYBLDRAFT_60557 [Phycomyces blakesleeanus NRRL 1555(-)]
MSNTESEIPCQHSNDASKQSSIRSTNTMQEMRTIKQRLADALGDNGPLYWSAMKEFITGNLSRIEFDFYANLYLNRQNAYLHNAFILSTIQNSKVNSQPVRKPNPQLNSKRKRIKESREVQELEARKKLKMDVMSLSRADRESLNKLVKAGNTIQLKAFVDKALGNLTGQSPCSLITRLNNDSSLESLPPPICREAKELPDQYTLNVRMKLISLQHGLLDKLEDDVVDVMALALQIFLKNIISDIITKRRVNRPVGLSISSHINENGTHSSYGERLDTYNKFADMNSLFKTTSLSPLSSLSYSHTSSIDCNDFAFALDMSPSAPIEIPLYKEKLKTFVYKEDSTNKNNNNSSKSGSGLLPKQKKKKKKKQEKK